MKTQRSQTRWIVFILALTVALPVAAARLEVFVAGTDRALWTNAGENGRWSGWQRIGGQIIGSPDAVAGPGFVDVFAIGMDKSLVHIRRTGQSWSEWYTLGGELESSPGAVRLSNGDIHVFARGSDLAIWHIANHDGTWGDWEPIGGEFDDVRPAAVDLGNGRLEVLARGQDNQIWSRRFEGSSWGEWEPIEGGTLVADPAAVVTGSYVNVIALGGDGRHWHASRGTGSGAAWSEWLPYDGEAFAAGHGSDAAVDGSETVLVTRGRDRAPRIRTNARWTSLGGEIAGNPAIIVARSGASSDRPAPKPPSVTSGVYRVTINGFIVNRETADDPHERDGARDEVFIHANSGVVGEPRGLHWNSMTRTFGDVHADPGRIRAGSARGVPGVGADGGMMTGDSYPTPTPWIRSIEPFRPTEPPDGAVIDLARQGVDLPMIAWEGELVRGRNALLIVPAIIEKDHRLEPSDRQTQNLARDLPSEFSAQLMGVTLANVHEVQRALSEAIASRIRYRRGPDPSDRPIGMQLEGEQYVWRTSPIVLTFDIAEDMVRRHGEYTDIRRRPDGSAHSITQPLPLGVSYINVRDHDALGGDYTLFWQIEKIR